MKLSKQVFLVIIMIMLALTGCSTEEAATGEGAPEDKETPVKTAKVLQDKLEVSQELVGTVKADANVSIIPKASGEILKINVAKGDVVEKGQVLAEIDNRDLHTSLKMEQEALKQAQVQLNSAKAAISQREKGVENAEANMRMSDVNNGTNESTMKIQWDNAKTHLDRIKPLYEAGAVSKAEYDEAVSNEERARLSYVQAKTTAEESKKQAQISIELAQKDVEQARYSVEQAQVSVNQAQLRVKQAQDRLNDSKVKSTISGEVVNVSSEVGDQASAQSPLFTVVSIDPVKVESLISAEQLKLFKQRENVNIRIASIGKDVTGVITYISPIANDSGLYSIEAEVKNGDKAIKPGMAATFVISEVLVEEALLVPTEAIVESAEGAQIYVVEEGRAVLKNIEVIQSQTDVSAVTGEIKENDEIVVKGQNTLADGNKVNIIEEGR